MTTSASGREPVRIKISEDLIRKLVHADSSTESGESTNDRQKRLYEQSCNYRETHLYRLFQDVVNQFNGKLKARREIMRLVDEGDGLHLELE